jgi:succinoglycan biosynthesis protein ExoM
MGPVRAVVPEARPWWLTGPELFRPPIEHPGGAYEGEVYSSNTSLRMDFVREHGLRFDSAFNASGGEDTDFFRRLRDAGGTVVWAPEAWVTETIDAERLTYYALERRRPDPRMARHLARRAGRLGRGAGRLVSGSLSGNRGRIVAGLADIAIVEGTVRAALGWRPAGYDASSDEPS